ncbi:RNA polymerase sigma factor SigC [Mycolicibacterium fluoranthenivorans]|uniref:RNA polymerase sigma factor n=1 Tax=Mycolicibacterium fluoranthenivorans TaxID=258505 RepID=A0A7X5TW62_9MYCO|nr:RNA polymerase sigma factor SigC [Mycolicibacterium fluoranthenivorans]MCV7355179.1 RNA polymerase sigma factor SigC [Mycolicibacterium fluoranthenivorans]NIH93870.1 RNA polymerase sigma-70 factor (ECF subfamily) [Mycolicibacterium fluoranthenivorans]
MADCGDDDQVTQLAKSAGRGDQAALSRFVEATQRDVWRTVAYLADPASADDLTQETFLRAIKSLPRFSGRSTARTWLLSIARRVVVDQIRYNTSRPRPAHVVDLDDVLGGLGGGSRIENMVEIRILLDGLEPERREALVLTQVLGMSYAEAAEVAGCPIGTIRSRVARARDDLLRAAHQDDRTG